MISKMIFTILRIALCLDRHYLDRDRFKFEASMMASMIIALFRLAFDFGNRQFHQPLPKFDYLNETEVSNRDKLCRCFCGFGVLLIDGVIIICDDCVWQSRVTALCLARQSDNFRLFFRTCLHFKRPPLPKDGCLIGNHLFLFDIIGF